MTRIFGYQKKAYSSDTDIGVNTLLHNLQVAITTTYRKHWQAFGLGFIVVDGSNVHKFSVFKGYRGIGPNDNVVNLLPRQLKRLLSNNPRAVFGVLQNSPDKGKQLFERDTHGLFPLESDNWLAITMGKWWNDGFTDETLPWYNRERPALSIVNYLETNPKTINFDWADKRRIPYIVAVKKDGTGIYIIDKYSEFNAKGTCYVKEELNGIVIYQGVRDSTGIQC